MPPWGQLFGRYTYELQECLAPSFGRMRRQSPAGKGWLLGPDVYQGRPRLQITLLRPPPVGGPDSSVSTT